MVIDAHSTVGHEQETPAPTEKGGPGNVGQYGELSARLAAATEMLDNARSVEPAVITIGRALLFLTNAERAAIFLRSPSGRVTCPWSHNLSDAYVQDIVTPKDVNPWMHILRHPELSCMDLPKTSLQTSPAPWVLPDALALSSDHAHLVDRITPEGIRSMRTWPLVQAGRVTGALLYCYDAPHGYSQDEQEVMGVFGAHAAPALRDPGAPPSQAQGTTNARDTTRTPTDSLAAFGLTTAGSAPKPQIVQAPAPKTGADEAGRLQELSPMWDVVAPVGPESRQRSDPVGPSRRRRAALVAGMVIAAVATGAVLGIGSRLHGPAVRTIEHQPAAQMSVIVAQKPPVPTPHRAIAAGVVPSVAKPGVPPATSRAIRPRKAEYVVVVGTFENPNTAAEMKRVVQSKGYVVRVVLQGAVSKVMTAPMRTRTQAEGVARGLEAAGLQPQLIEWQGQ